MEPGDGSPGLYALGLVAVALTAYLHVAVLPAYFPDEPLRATPSLLIGWGSFTLVFYVLARLFSEPGPLPSMRGADIGAALFVATILIAEFAGVHGYASGLVSGGYVVYAVGIYPGLALLGWAIGRRTKAINRIASESAE